MDPYTQGYPTSSTVPGAPPASHTAAAQRTVTRVALGLFAFSVVPTVLCLGVQLLVQMLCPALLNDLYFSVALQCVTMYGIAFPLACLIMGPPPPAAALVRRQKMPAWQLLCYFCMFETGAILGSFIGQYLAEILGAWIGAPLQNTLDETVSALPTWLTILWVVLLAPLMEELLFRRAVIDRLAPYGEKAAVLFSALAFGLAHGNFFQLFYCIAVGILCGYIYVRTRRISYTVILHMVFNFFGSVVILYLSEQAHLDEWAGADSLTYTQLLPYLGPILLLLLYVFLVYGAALAGGILLCCRWKNARFRPTIYPLPTGTSLWRTYLCNVGTILLAAYAIFTFAMTLVSAVITAA